MTNTEILSSLTAIFEHHANPEIAAGQKAYLKDHFEFYGIKAPIRKIAQANFLRKPLLPNWTQSKELLMELWVKDEREYQQFGLELARKHLKNLELDDLDIIQFLIVNKSWWDSVDAIAAHIVGAYFLKFPKRRDDICNDWLNSDNLWLQRTCLIYQLNYKQKTDTVFLTYSIGQLTPSKEFFINKAIGWALRQYSKTNPKWVKNYVLQNPDLHSLSKKEALRLMN